MADASQSRQLGLFNIRVLHQPSLDHLSFKAPLIAHFEGRQFPLGHQTVDGKFVDTQITGYLTCS